MSRPLRVEYPGALYHVTSRGNDQQAIYRQDADYQRFIQLLEDVCKRFNWRIYAYCLMPNHYHLLVETPEANLSRGMRQLNGVYTQKFNRVHKRVGHLFQGRFKAILVDKDSYLLELSRYIVLNPVRANGLANSPEEWPWSSYRAMIGEAEPQPWLVATPLLEHFHKKTKKAIKKYQAFVAEGVGVQVWDKLQSQIFLGSKDFIQQHKQGVADEILPEVPAAQRRPPAKPLQEYVAADNSAKANMAKAYLSGAYTMKQIADAFDVHYSTVSRAVANFKT
ncbi:transposase [Aliiglaciecola sp. CAU 1673]|uniref:REP-associated tyrosine transposase n=1 Tax=Aliiglaciecola sp. CAU 1673 TaxID=3032595 RepID=UPI0023DA112E|nr:transposase [Aliiglaciecola sp. CAU 1673]MDF2176713.1 transposase [Aliiglaciecola sp. CAU 1673]